MRARLPHTLKLVGERERKLYNSGPREIEEVRQSFRDFVSLCEQKGRETGEPVRIIASYEPPIQGGPAPEAGLFPCKCVAGGGLPDPQPPAGAPPPGGMQSQLNLSDRSGRVCYNFQMTKLLYTAT